MNRIDDRITRFIDECADSHASSLRTFVDFDQYKDYTAIETLFLIGLVHHALWCAPDTQPVRGQFPVTGKSGKEYRVDFALLDGNNPVLFIELDGHDFHEKTKEQVQHDKERERDIVATGVRLIRFSGSEVWRDPAKCVDEAWDVYKSLLKKS